MAGQPSYEDLIPFELSISSEITYADRRILTSFGLPIPSNEDFIDGLKLYTEIKFQLLCELAGYWGQVMYFHSARYRLGRLAPGREG